MFEFWTVRCHQSCQQQTHWLGAFQKILCHLFTCRLILTLTCSTCSVSLARSLNVLLVLEVVLVFFLLSVVVVFFCFQSKFFCAVLPTSSLPSTCIFGSSGLSCSFCSRGGGAGGCHDFNLFSKVVCWIVK